MSNATKSDSIAGVVFVCYQVAVYGLAFLSSFIRSCDCEIQNLHSTDRTFAKLESTDN